jgi:hypothetical protein
MPFFQKKPVVIEAIQLKQENVKDIWHMLGKDDKVLEDFINIGQINVPALEGIMTASVGDWIIKGAKGEFYPCKPDIFELTYKPLIKGETIFAPEVIKEEEMTFCGFKVPIDSDLLS